VERDQRPTERALEFVRLLAGVEPDWRPQPYHYLWAIRIVIAGTLIAFGFDLFGSWLWQALVDYIRPQTPTDRKDVANILVVIAAGVVGTLTALAALGNLYISRRNLENARAALRQQRDLDLTRRSAEALQAYFEQMGGLLLDEELHTKADRYDVTRVTARARTLAVLGQLDGERKRTVLLFLRESRLINSKVRYRNGRVVAYARLVGLEDADLKEVDLREARLISTDRWEAVSLEGANLVRR
jgi:ABC-type multidrug transport system fused ATPase/permease subunit